MQTHNHEIKTGNILLGYYQTTAAQGNNMGGLGSTSSTNIYAKDITNGRTGTPDVTHGKQKGVKYIIKVL